ncbi:hypothetical protein IEN91_04575 [Bacillus velezensis]|uniref:hypothetical protein n=1 Tax=Bacillus velezensis TaxID=492670 RepID=UPI0018C64984|nr:hypothetical protein [Bacillus velezensis]QPK89730.1 hypothetical protein IEN91_04575 [Bacillus velezensis]
MNTKVAEVYDAFLSKITDYTFLKMTDEQLETQARDYFKASRRKFYKCKSDLKTIADEDGNELFQEFKVELHPYEVEILASLMVIEYIQPMIASTETLKQVLSDKSFKISSQANQLRELRLLKREMRSEVNTMITQYTYLNLKEVNLNAKKR